MTSERVLQFSATLPCEESASPLRSLFADSAVDHGNRAQFVAIDRVMEGMRLASCLASQRLAPIALSVAVVILRRVRLTRRPFNET